MFFEATDAHDVLFFHIDDVLAIQSQQNVPGTLFETDLELPVIRHDERALGQGVGADRGQALTAP